MPHFFATDLIGLTCAFLLGIPLILLPGYALGYWANLLRFREQTSGVRLSLATVFGVSLFPVIIYLVQRFLGLRSVWLLVLLLCVLAIVALLRGHPWSGLSISRPAMVVILVWLLLGSALLLDIKSDNKVFVPWVAFDHAVRTQVVAALATNPSLPPVDYFSHPGHDVSLRYHYFSFFFGALMERAGAGLVSARMGLNASILWFGLALLAIYAAFLRLFVLAGERKQVPRWAWLLLAITGLDIVPIALEILNRAVMQRADLIPFPTIDWWNAWGQATSWIDTLLWVPNHASALVACLAGALLLWDSRTRGGASGKWSWITAGVAFASATGLSVYVTVVFAVLFFGLTVYLLKSTRRAAIPLIGAGVVAVGLSVPFLLELLRPPMSGTGYLLQFAVRPFQPAEALLRAAHIQAPFVWNTVNFFALPLNFLFELGFFVVIALWWWRDRRLRGVPLSSQDRLMIALFWVSIVISTFFRSGTRTSNDLQWRGLLPAQFILLLWAAELLERYRGRVLSDPWLIHLKRIAKVTAVVGIGSMLLEIGLLRCYVPLSDAGIAETHQTLADQNIGSRTMDLREAYLWLRNHTPQDSVIQENPAEWQALALGLYAERRAAVFGQAYALGGGASFDEYRRAYYSITPLYRAGVSWDQVENACHSNQINYIVFQDTDAIWYDRRSFVWSQPPVFTSARVRVFRCG